MNLITEVSEQKFYRTALRSIRPLAVFLDVRNSYLSWLFKRLRNCRTCRRA
jgi:hypothetical protein